MSVDVEQRNSDPEFRAAVDLLCDRYGPEAAERRLLAALSEVRRRKIETARRGSE